MSRTTAVRRYGKQQRKPRPEPLFTEASPSPVAPRALSEDPISKLTQQLTLVTLKDDDREATPQRPSSPVPERTARLPDVSSEAGPDCETSIASQGRRTLVWADVCPPGDKIEKIAEASYAEVYRVTNERGTSIIKAIRLDSPIRPQTKAQGRSGLVDEEPHSERDLLGELQISEWLADIPGFVVYKERYVVRGRAPKALLETHQTFHRKIKRKDPDRLQFYPSPSRYLDDTEFLVVELGDAGTALEDFALVAPTQLWDIFLNVAIALARAEDQIKFEHRDLHEGNLCIRQMRTPREKDLSSPLYYGYSGLEVTILDYGLSRAEDVLSEKEVPMAFDLERELSIFTSTHAPQCKVYRQMRSFLLRGDRIHLPPEHHRTPYDEGPEGPISWREYKPYSNVLWLAYLYDYLTGHFQGGARELARFRRTTAEFWSHLNPDAPPEILSFPSATDVVAFAAEAGWVSEAQLCGHRDISGCSEALDESCNDSIIEAHIVERVESELRRSPRRPRPRVLH